MINIDDTVVDQEQPEKEEANEIAASKIEAFSLSILKKRQEAVEGRAASGIEREWRTAEVALEGRSESEAKNDMIQYATGEAYLSPTDEARRSKVVVNILRGKAETAIGRFSEILLPVDSANFQLKCTPKPYLVKSLDDETPIKTDDGLAQTENGEPLTVADKARKEMDDAERAMERMQTEIEDQLSECGFNGECRKVVKSAVNLGTGILKGPFVSKKIKKAWIKIEDSTGEVWDMDISETQVPESKCVDVWDVYPDPNCGGDIAKASYIWERDTILPRELRDLIGLPGFLEDQVLLVLADEPKKTTVEYSKTGTHKMRQNTASMGNAYERWFYYGDASVDDLTALGVDLDDTNAASVSCCVEFVNDRPIRVTLNMIDSGELPYDFFQWVPRQNTVWGMGLIIGSLDQQRIITAAWRSMMDNAGDSSGVNTIIGPGVEPADGIWELTGKKLWWATNDGIDDVRKAFTQFQVANNQAELQAIIDLTLRFIDMETQMPMLFQGEQGKLPDTLGATNIMVDSNNVAFRSRVKIWDDNITRPHLTRYYDYNMLYNDSSDIKGDFSVEPIGSSVFLERDQQGQTLLNLMNLKQDPDFNRLVDWDKVAEKLLGAQKLDVLKTAEQLQAFDEAQKQAQEQPPEDSALQVAQIRAESEAKTIEARLQVAQISASAKMQIAQAQQEHELELKTADLQIAMMKADRSEKVELEKAKERLTTKAAEIGLQRELAGKDGHGPQVLEPPVEPPPRAANGRAYQD